MTTDERLLRSTVHAHLEEIRTLRNRIAHHEPIVGRDLEADLDRMFSLVAIRSAEADQWLRMIEECSAAIAAQP